jgi:hypothetical protein
MGSKFHPSIRFTVSGTMALCESDSIRDDAGTQLAFGLRP